MRLCEYRKTVWRFVEDQNRASTMKLADSLSDQKTLEELLDASKPPVPEPCRHLHYLQFTPFRYRPRVSTRFRAAGSPLGVFYAAESVETAAAEMAFYRMLFFAESPGLAMPEEPFALSVFSTEVESAAALDLTQPDWDANRATLEHTVDYSATLALADRARAEGAELIRYNSVRAKGANVAVLSCAAFRTPNVETPKGWLFSMKRDRVIARQDFGDANYEFPVADFAGDPRIEKALRDGTLAA